MADPSMPGGPLPGSGSADRREQERETPESPLQAERVFSGVRWSAIGQGASQAGRFFVSIALARLLVPEDFGLMAMAGVFTALASLFANLGLGPTIVQHPQLTERLLRSLATLGVAVGFGISLLLLALSGTIARFYGDPRVLWVVATVGMSFAVASFGLVHEALLQRELRFAPLVKIDLTVMVASSSVAITMAALGYGVWSLVAATLINAAARVVLLNLVSSWRLRFGLDWGAIRSVAGFSTSVLGFGVMTYLNRNADTLLIGRLLGAIELGYYNYAYRFYMYAVDSIMGVLIRVLFPTFARLQHDKPKLGQAFLRANGAIALITFPMMTGLAVLAGPVVWVLLGEKWTPIIPLVTVFAPIGMVNSIGSTPGQVFLARGKAAFRFWWSVVYTAIIVAAIAVGVRWGILGVAMGIAVVMVPINTVYFWLALRLVDLGLIDIGRTISRTTFVTGVMAAAVLALRAALTLAGATPLIVLCCCVPFGVAVYALGTRVMRPTAVDDLFRLLPTSLRTVGIVQWLFQTGPEAPRRG